MKQYKSQVYDESCYAEWRREDNGNTYCMVYWRSGNGWAPYAPIKPGETVELERMALQELVQILREHNLPASARTLEEWLKLDAQKKKAANGTPLEALALGCIVGGI